VGVKLGVRIAQIRSLFIQTVKGLGMCRVYRDSRLRIFQGGVV